MLVHSTFLLALVVPHCLSSILSSVTFVPTVCIRLWVPAQAVFDPNVKAKSSVSVNEMASEMDITPGAKFPSVAAQPAGFRATIMTVHGPLHMLPRVEAGNV